MKLETTAEEQYVAELIKDRGHYPKLARRMFDERNTLLTRNEELERALEHIFEADEHEDGDEYYHCSVCGWLNYGQVRRKCDVLWCANEVKDGETHKLDEDRLRTVIKEQRKALADIEGDGE